MKAQTLAEAVVSASFSPPLTAANITTYVH